MTLKKLTGLAIASLVFVQASFANPMLESVTSINESAWKVRQLSNEMSTQSQDRQSYEAAHTQLQAESKKFATELVENNQWKEFSELYKTLDSMEKQNLEMVVENILAQVFQNQETLNVELSAQEYFPGYGYAKPGYTYRKGEEVGREFLYAYWKDQEIEESTSMEKELMIEVKLLAKFKAAIPELIEGVKLDIEIDGQIHEVVKIKVKKEMKIKTKQKLKFGVEKAWHKLYEAKKKWWGDLEWKEVGKTYQHDTVPTGEAVVTDAEI